MRPLEPSRSLRETALTRPGSAEHHTLVSKCIHGESDLRSESASLRLALGGGGDSFPRPKTAREFIGSKLGIIARAGISQCVAFS